MDRKRFRVWLFQHRWTILTIWIVIFTVVVTLSISRIREDSARVGQLEHTNCGLKQFLLTARNARQEAANRETGTKKEQDQAAADGYQRIASPFTATGHHCKLPRRVEPK